eukprot:6430173-Pyramimonas_sp.AAC.1
MTGAAAIAEPPAASAGQPAAPPYVWPNATATMPAAGMQMPLVAESTASAWAPAAATPAGLPANEAWLRR